MLETTHLLLRNNFRNVIRNIRMSPLLYVFFFSMMLGSIMLFAVLTFFIQQAHVQIRLEEVFFALFLIFLMKSAADMHTYFIKAHSVCYALSTPSNQVKTVGEIFLAIALTELLIWICLSTMYLVSCSLLGMNITYVVEYVFFCGGIFLACMLGCILVLAFYSPYQERLFLISIVFLHYWISQSFLAILVTTPGVVCYCIWSMRRAQDSYLFVPRKDRINEKSKAKVRTIIFSICCRELTVLWRERILISFVFAAVSTAVFTGYLSIYGTEIFIPEEIQKITGNMLPAMFVFLGLYVVVIYTSVFPGLNMFLNEEKTMWILRNLPVENRDVVYGKILALVMCYIASLPFLAYISIFIGLKNIIFLGWLLSFSFVIGVVVSIPLGAKYVGKKSDILLLYSVAMILFLITIVAASFGFVLQKKPLAAISFYIFMLAVAGLLLIGSVRLSVKILDQMHESTGRTKYI